MIWEVFYSFFAVTFFLQKHINISSYLGRTFLFVKRMQRYNLFIIQQILLKINSKKSFLFFPKLWVVFCFKTYLLCIKTLQKFCCLIRTLPLVSLRDCKSTTIFYFSQVFSFKTSKIIHFFEETNINRYDFGFTVFTMSLLSKKRLFFILQVLIVREPIA